MQESKINNSRRRAICLILTVVIYLLSPVSVIGNDAVDVIVTSHDQHDTVWATWPSTFDIYIANSEEMCGFALGHQVWSPDGASWHWLSTGYWGHSHIVRPNLDSRWGDMTCYDMATQLVLEQNIDEVGRDSIMLGASGMVSCCPSGPLEHMYSYNFFIDGPAGDDVLTLCIDSCFIPPSGAFIFLNQMGSTYPPTVLWPEGGRCWPVKMFPYVCGDANFDKSVNIGDVVFIIAFVFAGGPTPEPYCQANANGSHPVDLGDAVYLINYIFHNGPPPVEDCCEGYVPR